MQSGLHNAARSAVVATALLSLRIALAVTAGWENVGPGRREPYSESAAVWRADFSRKGDFSLEMRDGAEGSVDLSGGRLTVRKTNDKGYLLLRGKPFVRSDGAALRFSADVCPVDCEPEYCHAMLRAWESREFLGLRPEDKGVDSPGGRQLMNGLVNMPEGMFYRKYFHHKPEAGTVTPAIVVCGRKSVSVWKNWMAEDDAAAKGEWRKVLADADRRRVAARLVDEDEFSRRIASDVEHTARVFAKDGRSVLEVDGVVVPPVAFHTVYHHGDGSEMAAGGPLVANGVKLVVPIIEGGTGLRPCWDSSGYDAKKAVDILRKTMRAGGDALYIVCYSCNAYRDFVAKDHPGEGWIAEGGKPLCGSAGSCCVGYQGMTLDKAWPWVSMASRVWRDAVCANIRAFVAEMKRQGLDRRVVGIHLCGYNDGQFGMNRPDFSPCAKAEYAKYVAGANGRSTNYYHFCRQLGVMAQEEFARAFKESMGKDVVAIRWYDSPFVVDFALGETLRSDAIDIVVPQPEYQERAPAIAAATFAPFSSFHLHGKMLWNELDLRTWWMPSSGTAGGYRTVCPADDLAAWQTIYRKYAGEMIANRCGYWLYDMGRGWFAAPEIAADVGESLRTIRRLCERRPSPWRPDVALVIDEEGFLGWDGGERPFPAHTYNMSEKQIRLLANAGVPYEYYLAEDVMERPSLLDGMKTIVFMLWRRFDERRVAFAKGLSRQGRTLVFLAESGSLGGAREATGFGIDFDFAPKCLAVSPVPGAGIDTVGSFDLEQIRGGSFGNDPRRPMRPPYGRRGEIAEESGVRVLGRFADDGKAAVAERVDNGCRRLYVSAPGGLSPSWFNRIARESGAYVPVDAAGLQVNMNGDFVSVHAARGGRFAFRLPFPCGVTNVKTGEREPAPGGVLNLDVTPGETCWFLLDVPPTSETNMSFYISNHDQSRSHRVIHPIIGKTNFVYDAHGDLEKVKGEAIAYLVKDSSNVTIRNLRLDWERPCLTEARIDGFSGGRTVVTIDRALFPCVVEGGVLRMTGPGWTNGVWLAKLFNGQTHEQIPGAGDVEYGGDYRNLVHYRTVLEYAKRNGWAFVGPNFRGPNSTPESCGSDLAVRDIVDAVGYAKGRVRIDASRVYIIGGSGGGHMTLLMLGRHPEIFAAGAAFCPISDLARWHGESLAEHPGRCHVYAEMLESVCGGSPQSRPEEYRRRSPVAWLSRAKASGVPTYIATGIHDGWRGSVPVGHAVRAFNELVDGPDRIPKEEIAYMEANQSVPKPLASAPHDPFYPDEIRIHLRRTCGNAQLTLFEGGHDCNFRAGFEFLSRQRKGHPADWTLPVSGEGSVEALSR